MNLRTNEMRIAGQTRSGSGLWHVHGSPDGRWAVGDDFERNLYLIDRTTDEMQLLSGGHKTSARIILTRRSVATAQKFKYSRQCWQRMTGL